MKYKIYELVSPEHLKRIDYDGYHPRTIERYVLEPLDALDETYSSMDDAMNVISAIKEKVRGKSLVILPVVNIHWDGEIS